MRWANLLQVGSGHVAAVLAIGLVALLVVRFRSGRREAFLPGVTSNGHHLQEAACDSCHDAFRGTSSEKCLACHRGSLEHDTHAASIFNDPRWAEPLERLDATRCVTCHKEHRIARGGVTADASFCFACHDDVVSRRPSHASFASNSCGRGGCHEYHDNTGLDLAYLKLHASDPDNLPSRARLTRVRAPAPFPAAPAAEYPASVNADAGIVSAWAASQHASGRVNCMDCHKGTDGSFVASPGTSPCRNCHKEEAATYGSGKHGIRESVGLTAATPALARLPMRPHEPGQPERMSCTTCHDAHRVDTRKASVEACLACHDDAHSRAYRNSKHAGAREDAVTCATCHMPRVTVNEGGKTRVAVDHDVGRSIHPRSRMAREVCMDCHGLDLTLSSLFDEDEVASNFRGPPRAQHPTVAMVQAIVARNSEKGVGR